MGIKLLPSVAGYGGQVPAAVCTVTLPVADLVAPTEVTLTVTSYVVVVPEKVIG